MNERMCRAENLHYSTQLVSHLLPTGCSHLHRVELRRCATTSIVIINNSHHSPLFLTLLLVTSQSGCKGNKPL